VSIFKKNTETRRSSTPSTPADFARPSTGRAACRRRTEHPDLERNRDRTAACRGRTERADQARPWLSIQSHSVTVVTASSRSRPTPAMDRAMKECGGERAWPLIMTWCTDKRAVNTTKRPSGPACSHPAKPARLTPAGRATTLPARKGLAYRRTDGLVGALPAPGSPIIQCPPRRSSTGCSSMR
jgi:hypothetical protein